MGDIEEGDETTMNDRAKKGRDEECSTGEEGLFELARVSSVSQSSVFFFWGEQGVSPHGSGAVGRDLRSRQGRDSFLFVCV